MRVVQEGDRLRVHCVRHFHDGSVESPPTRGMVRLTVGVAHPWMPGLKLSLVGLAVGESKTILVPAEQAHGPYMPSRIYRLSRGRFEEHPVPAIGKWVQIWDSWNRRRWVKIVAVRRNMVVVDANHRRAGQDLVLRVKVITIEEEPGGEQPGHAADLAQDNSADRWRDDGGQG